MENYTINCLGVAAIENDNLGQQKRKYLICNGPMMGKWTTHFGVHCVADTFDCKEYAKLIASTKDHYELFEVILDVR